jgi:hypothetical protein
MRAGLCLDLGDAPEARGRPGWTADAAIGPEHGHAFGQMVDRLALDLDQRVVAGFEIDLFGQVFEHPGRAALRVGGCEDAQRLAVRQVPEIGLRVDRAIDGKRGFLPGCFQFSCSGSLLGGAQPVEQLAIAGLALSRKAMSRSQSARKAWL